MSASKLENLSRRKILFLINFATHQLYNSQARFVFNDSELNLIQ